MLLCATAAALTRSTVAIVFAKREGYLYASYAHQLAAELTRRLPGLRARVTPLYNMRPGEEGCPDSPTRVDWPSATSIGELGTTQSC